MKKATLLTIVLTTAFLTAPGIVQADKWAAPKPRVYGSSWGTYGMKVLPGEIGQAAEGILFQIDAQGKDVVVWQKKLVNIPHRVFVGESKQVVTIDTYARLGYAHALVVYDEKGNVLKDYQLEGLLTAEEIQKNVKATVSSRHWLNGARFDFEGDHFVVRLSWGRTLRVDLQTGNLKAEEK